MGNMWGTYGTHMGNIWGVSGEHLVVYGGIVGEYGGGNLVNIWCSYEEYVGEQLGTCGE